MISPGPNPWQELAGDIVVLEPLDERHEVALFAAAQPAEIWDGWPFNPAIDRQTFHQWLQRAVQASRDGREARFATVDRATGVPLGSTSFCMMRPEHHRLEIGWTWLTPAAWGTGVNAEAKLLMLEHAFERLGGHRVELETDVTNWRSRAAIEALPATFEGVHREDKLVHRTRWRSSAYYSILSHEWPHVRDTLRGRIDVALQRRSLATQALGDRPPPPTGADPEHMTHDH